MTDRAHARLAATGGSGRLAALRAHWRLARVGLHLGCGLATAALVYPFVGRPQRLALKQRWSRQLLGMLGVHCSAAATPPAAPALLVANHVSWLDIFVINAVTPACFVCKADVRDWPLIGWLCQRTETVFMPRGSRRAAHEASGLVADRLRQGWQVAVFPEGTTSDGTQLLPFHGALLQGAVEAGCRVQPLALRYSDATGRLSDAAAYCGDTTLLQSLRSLASASGLQVRLDILPPLDGRGAERRELAAAARRSVHRALNRTDAHESEAEEVVPGFSLAAT
jgi:1-acyl-sn-glycerol-3-phosphate acyltransferase